MFTPLQACVLETLNSVINTCHRTTGRFIGESDSVEYPTPCLFQAFFGGGIEGKFPHKKITIPSPTTAELCALNLLSARATNYKYITEKHSFNGQ